MVYFRTLPVPLNEIDDDFLELFFNFANTYTESSILTGFLNNKQEKEKLITKKNENLAFRMGIRPMANDGFTNILDLE